MTTFAPLHLTLNAKLPKWLLKKRGLILEGLILECEEMVLKVESFRLLSILHCFDKQIKRDKRLGSLVW